MLPFGKKQHKIEQLEKERLNVQAMLGTIFEDIEKNTKDSAFFSKFWSEKVINPENMNMTEKILCLSSYISLLQNKQTELIKENHSIKKKLNETEEENKKMDCDISLLKMQQNLKTGMLYREMDNNYLLLREISEPGNNIKQNFLTEFNTMSNAINQYCTLYSIEEIAEKSYKRNVDTVMRMISQIREEVKQYEKEIHYFQGTRQDKSYLHLREMLIRILQKLDGVDSRRDEQIIAERRKAVELVENLLRILENKVTRKVTRI